MEFPKMLYGESGWDKLEDCRLVNNQDEEDSARKDGYSELGKMLSDEEKAAAEKAAAEKAPAKKAAE